MKKISIMSSCYNKEGNLPELQRRLTAVMANFGQIRLAPLAIELFFFSSVQLIFIGIVGEYIGAIWTQVKNKTLVIEEERINFRGSSVAPARSKTLPPARAMRWS